MGRLVNARPRSLYPWGRDPVPNVQADWAPGLVLTGAENLATHWDSSSDRPANSEPPYRLCYPGPQLRVCVFRGSRAPSGPGPPHYRGYTIAIGHITLIRTLLGAWSARRWDFTWQHTALTRDSHPYTRRHPNPQFQRASGRRPTP